MKPPTTNHQPPTTNHQPTTNNQQPTAQDNFFYGSVINNNLK